MREISDAIKEGAEAFLRRQNRTIGLLAVLLAVVIFILYGFVRGAPRASTRSRPPLSSPSGRRSPSSSAPPARSSPATSACGSRSAPNIRTASAARTSLNDALRTALRGGAVSGLFVVAMSLLGVGGLYWLVSHFTAGPARRRSRS